MGIKRLLFLLQNIVKTEQAPDEAPAVENPQNNESTQPTDIKTTVDPENS